MQVWAIANQKGGVGKTTTTVSLAGLLAARGKRVLMLDLDPHGSLTAYFGHDPDTLERSVYNLFQAEAEGQPERPQACIKTTKERNLYLMPASSAMATLDRQLGNRGGMGLVVQAGLKQLEKNVDYVLVDCPPVLGILLINAVAACDRLVIPVQTEFLALKGLERMRHTLTMVCRSKHLEIPSLVVPTLYDQRTRASVDSLAALRDQYNDVWHGVIPVDTRFRDLSRIGSTGAPYVARMRGMQAYAQLLDDLLMQTSTRSRAKQVAG